MRLMIAAKEGTEILVDILNQSFSGVKIREICGQDEFAMPNGYTDFSRYASLHKEEEIGEGKYARMTYGDFLLKLGSFTGKGGYLDKLIRNSMKRFTDGDEPRKRQGLFNRLYPGLMKYFRKDFKELFKDFDLFKPVMDTHYTTMMTDIAVIMNAIFGNHGRYLRDMNSAVNRFVAGNLDLEQFRGELNSINDKMSGSGESNGTAVEKSAGEAWNCLESSCRMKVPGMDQKYTWYKVDNHEDLWPVATSPVTDWCVAQKGNSGRHFFDEVYRPPYYMLCDGRHPVILLHVDSHQFKDVKDHPIKLDRPSKLKFVESGMKLLEKLDYSGGYRGDFKVFQEYLDDVNGLRKDYDYDLEDAIFPDDLEDAISPEDMGVLSDDEFARRLEDPDFLNQVIGFLSREDPGSVVSKLGKSKIGMLVGKDRKFDERLLKSPDVGDDLVLRILSEESKQGRNMMGRLFDLAMENADDSLVLKIMERFLCPELVYAVRFYSWSSDENAEKATRILLNDEDRIGRGVLLSSVRYGYKDHSIVLDIMRMSNDSVIIDAVFKLSMDWFKEGEHDAVLWNVVRNGGKESHESLLRLCPEKLSEEMSDYLLDRYFKDGDMFRIVITRASLSRDMVERLVSLGDKSMDRLLLQGQVLDDDLALRMIDELGDDYKGELHCRKNMKMIHKYSPEVVDAALEAAMRNDRGELIVETQDLSEENIREVVKNGSADVRGELICRNRLPKDLIDELLSSGDHDHVLGSHQPLDDGQIDELIRRHGDDAVEWIAGSDLIISRHAYDLIVRNLDSDDICSSLLKRKSIDWEYMLPVLLNGSVNISRRYNNRFLYRAARELNDEKSLLSIAGVFDINYEEILSEILNKNLSKNLIDGLLRCKNGDIFAYRMLTKRINLDTDQIHYIAEHFKDCSKELARMSGKIRLDDETVKLLKRWRNGDINVELLNHGYLDKDMDADEVSELLDNDDESDFIFNLHQVNVVGDGFIDCAVRNKDRRLSLGLCRNRYLSKSQVSRLLAMDPKDKEMRKAVAENNVNDDVIRMFEGTDDQDVISSLMENDYADESVLSEVCSTYSGEMTEKLAKEMDYRFGLIPPIEKSDFLFDVMKEYPDDFNDEDELVRLYGIGDEDVKWLCKKLCRKNLRKRLPVPESRTARIAGRICRRIVRMRHIAERISR